MGRLKWHLDEVANGRLRGWAVDLRAPDSRPVLDIFLQGEFVGQALANQFRNDLKARGLGDGFHGFEWRDPRLAGPDMAGQVAVEWPLIGLLGRSSATPAGSMGLRHFRSPDAYLAARLICLPTGRAVLPPTPRISDQSRPALLLRPVAGDPLGPCHGKAINAYQSYVLHRFRMESDFDPGFSLGGYRRFLRWYIRHYGSVRANLRIPLSEQDLAFLHAPAEGDPDRLEVMALFTEDFADRPGFERADWSFYNAPSLGIADCLDVAPGSDWLDLFARQHPILARLDLARSGIRDDVRRMMDVVRPAAPTGAADFPRLESTFLPVTEARQVDVQIIGPFSKALGVGESCRRMAQALQLTDFSLRTCDFSIDYPNAGISELQFILEEPGPASVNLIHLNLEEIPKLMAFWPDVFSDAINIAVPYLELSCPAPEQELGLALVDRVFAATEHIRSVIGTRATVDVVGNAVELTPLPDRPAARRAALGSLCGPDDFVVLASGDALSGLDRKNLTGAVRAFTAAFPGEQNRRLVIKTHSLTRSYDARQRRIWEDIREVAGKDRRIVLIDSHLDPAGYRSLQAACDVYLSLHRAEGLGYHVLECMQLGTPCIVTDYSGTRDFSSSKTAFLVGYGLVPAKTWEYPFTRGEQFWAEPQLSDAVGYLRMLAASPAKGMEVGRHARQLVHDVYALPAFADRLDALIRPLVSKEGRQ